MNKNKTTSIRINEKILKDIKKDGLTPQKIIDQYIQENYKIELTKKKSVKKTKKQEGRGYE